MPLFSTYLSHYRNEKGLSLRRIAEQIQVDPSYMSRLERGEIATPSDEILRNLAAVLERPLAEVYMAAGRMTPALAELLEQGFPLTVQQASKTLGMLEEQLQAQFADLGGRPLSDLMSPMDAETMTNINEAMMYIAEMVQGMENGVISQGQFRHIADTIKHLKLSHLAIGDERKTP